MELDEVLMSCRYMLWGLRLEDPAALRLFYAWLRHPACGGSLVSAIRSMYTIRGISSSSSGEFDFLEELRTHSLAATSQRKPVTVPRSKYDVWDVCASYVLKIPQRSAFVRLALTLSTYEAPQDDNAAADDTQLIHDASLVTFRDASVTKVFAAMVENFRLSESAINIDNTLQGLIATQVAQREAPGDQQVAFGQIGDFMDETDTVHKMFFTLLSLAGPTGSGVGLFLSKCEEHAWAARWEKYIKDVSKTQLQLLARLFVAQVMPSSPEPPEVFRPFVDKLKRGADLSLWPSILGPRLPLLRDIVMCIADFLFETRAIHDGGAQVNHWLNTTSFMYPRRLKRLQTELFRLEPALDEVWQLFHTWCATGRGKIKYEELLGRLRSRSPSLAEMLCGQGFYFFDCCSEVLGAEYATSFTNLVAVFHINGIDPAAPQQLCTPSELEAVRFKALNGEYQVLRPPKRPDYSRDWSLNKFLLVLVEDIFMEVPGSAAEFADLRALDRHPDIELDLGYSTIVTRKEVGTEVARLYMVWKRGRGLGVASQYGNRTQLSVIVALANFRPGPPYPNFMVIDPGELQVCREAVSDKVIGLFDLRGVDIRQFVQAFLHDLDLQGAASTVPKPPQLDMKPFESDTAVEVEKVDIALFVAGLSQPANFTNDIRAFYLDNLPTIFPLLETELVSNGVGKQT